MITRFNPRGAKQQSVLHLFLQRWVIISLIFLLQSLPIKAQTVPLEQPSVQTNSTAVQTKSTVDHPKTSTSLQSESSLLHEIWFFYLSSLALAITAGSTLLVALAIVKMQSLAIAIAAIEKSLAESFHRINKLDDYLKATSENVLNERWAAYFAAVEILSTQNEAFFQTKGRFHETKAYVSSLIQQGHKLRARSQSLHSTMPPVFVATAIVAGMALLAIPAVRWISPTILNFVWCVSGTICFVLAAIFLRLITSAFKLK